MLIKIAQIRCPKQWNNSRISVFFVYEYILVKGYNCVVQPWMQRCEPWSLGFFKAITCYLHLYQDLPIKFSLAGNLSLHFNPFIAQNECLCKSVTLCLSPKSLKMSDENESEPADEEEFEVENILDKRKRQVRYNF